MLCETNDFKTHIGLDFYDIFTTLIENYLNLVYWLNRNFGHWQHGRGGRVVKAFDSKSNGVSPHRFESCPRRNFFSPQGMWLRIGANVTSFLAHLIKSYPIFSISDSPGSAYAIKS